MAAGFTEALSPAVGQIEGEGFGAIVTRTAVSAAIGGTASKLSGGSFANGAQTGAFQQLFNSVIHEFRKYTSREARYAGAQAAMHELKKQLSTATFDTPEDAARAFCNRGACTITELSGFELGATIILKGGKFSLSTFRIGTETSADGGSTGYYGDIHTHPDNSGAGFSGGIQRVDGVIREYAGDIDTYINFPEGFNDVQGYVFHSGTRQGWHFDPVKMHNLLNTHVNSNYVGDEMATRRIQ